MSKLHWPIEERFSWFGSRYSVCGVTARLGLWFAKSQEGVTCKRCLKRLENSNLKGTSK